MGPTGSACSAIRPSKTPNPHSIVPHMSKAVTRTQGRRLQGSSISEGQERSLFIVFDGNDKMFRACTAGPEHGLHHRTLGCGTIRSNNDVLILTS